LRRRFVRRNRELGLPGERIHEFFTVTAWGEVPTEERIMRDFPAINPAFSNLEVLRKRLQRWRGGE